MHILIATPYLPWPLNAGGKVSQFSTLASLSKDHSFTIVCPIHSQKETEYVKQLEERLPHVRVKPVLFYTVPTSPTTYSILRVFLHKVLSRIRQLLQQLKPNLKEEKEEDVIEHPYYPFKLLSASFIQALSEELENNVDILQVEFADMLTLGILELPNIPKIFVNHQIHWIYAKRHTEIHGLDEYSGYLVGRIYAEESLLISKFDSIIVFSKADAQELSTVVKENKIHVSPFPVPADIDIAVTTNPISGKSFTFVGSQQHGPNRDALEWLLLDIWPLIKASIPQAQLFVIGDWSQSWCSNHQLEDVTYTGFIENIAEIMQGTIQLVPIRIGSGIRTKILTAMAQGVPVVSTTVGIEGIDVCDLEHALVRDTAEEFAIGAITLANDQTLADHLANRALDFVRDHYSPEVVQKARNKIYEAVIQSRR